MSKEQEILLGKILTQLKSMSNGVAGGAKSSASNLDGSNDKKKEDNFFSDLLDKKLKNSADYIKLQTQIIKQEEKLVKLKSENNQQETISDRLAQNILKIEKLRTMASSDVHKISNAERKAHAKEIVNITKENKMLLDQEKREKKILKLKEKQALEQDKINKKHKYLLATSKGLEKVKDSYKKITSTNAWKDSTELIKDQAKQLTGLNGGILGFISKTLNELWEQDSVLSKLSANYALSRKETGQLKQNITHAAIQTQRLGVSASDLGKMQQTYTDEMGRSVILTEENMVNLAQMGVATALGAEGAANMAASMEQFGYSANGSVGLIEGLMKRSKSIGVSNSVMAKKFQENLKVANSYTFKEGLKGVAEMTTYSTKFRINMQSIAGFADKISSPEGAIQTAASLQVLGGAFASMSDPMVLLNQGITDMEGLTKTYTKMLSSVGQIDKKTGEVTINGYDRLRVKAAAEAMGISFDEMMTTARTKAKRTAIESDIKLNPTLGGADEDAKDLVASLAQYDEGKGFMVNVRGKATSVAKLSAEDLKILQPKNSELSLKTIAEATLGISDLLQNAVKAFMQIFINRMMPAVVRATEYIASVIEKIANVLGGKGGVDTNNMRTKASATSGGLTSLLKGIGNSSKIVNGVSKGNLGATMLSKGAKFGGSKIPIIGSLLSGGAEFMETGSVNRALGAGVGSFGGGWGGAAAGAALGTMVAPVIGTIIGGILGGIAGGWGGSYLGAEAGGYFDKGNDVLVPSRGKPIKLDTKDDVFAMKPGGAIVNALNPSNNASKTFGGVTQAYSSVYGGNRPQTGSMNLNISGTITLMGGTSSTKISASELVKDRQFVRELTRLIGQQKIMDSNGGKYAGGLNNNSF